MLCLWWNLVKFYPLVPPTLDFFSDFYWDMLGHWINIYNLFYHIVVLKKKLLKIVLLGHYLGKNWASMSHTQNEAKFFFLETTKEDHKLSRTFCFIKISYILTALWMIFWLVWYFAAKTSQFWAETGILNLSSINSKDWPKYSTVETNDGYFEDLSIQPDFNYYQTDDFHKLAKKLDKRNSFRVLHINICFLPL